MKTAIVTGASSGIGTEICRILVKNNYKVYGLGRDFSHSNLISDLFTPVVCDITQTTRLAVIIKELMKKEDIHVLVNNAGVGYFGPHEELNPKKIHEMTAVNLEAPLILSHLLLRKLKENKGFIINISSVTAKKSNTYGCAYGATKAGLSSFSESLFEEVRKYGVKVVTIHPDMTKTNFYDKAGFYEGKTMDTYLLPEEIAQAVILILNQREGLVISEVTIKPQKHQIQKREKK